METCLAAETARVSFFVQAYNTARYVGECLQSILAQQGGYAFDVLVIDDASTDGTADEIARVKDPRVRVVRHDRNHGAMATANEGYLGVRGDFLVRIDSDDRLRPQFLLKTVPLLAHNPGLGMVYGDVATVDETGRVTAAGGVVNRHGLPETGNEFFPLLMDNYVPAPATLVRRAALEGVLPAPAGLSFVDWHVTTAVAERWDSQYVPEVLADYRVHPLGMHRTMILDRSGEASSLQILDARLDGSWRRAEKRRWRRRVYASHYLTYADKYFGAGMTADARRCYWQAVCTRPSALLSPGVGRRLAGSVIGRRSYDSIKKLVLQQDKRSQ
jgi:glycosyltransferase involved in cell wall biosynthesis